MPPKSPKVPKRRRLDEQPGVREVNYQVNGDSVVTWPKGAKPPKGIRRRRGLVVPEVKHVAAFIPWDAPELISALQEKLGAAASGWTMAAAIAPQRPDAKRVLAMARILGAAHLAVELGEDDQLEKLEEIARAYLRSRNGDVIGGAGGQAEDLAQRITTCVERNVDLPGLTDLFLYSISVDGSGLARKIAQAGIDLKDHDRIGLNPDAVRRVRAAFGRELNPSDPASDDIGDWRRRPGDDIGERLVQKGLEALGYPGARNIFSWKAKREKRRLPPTN